jgi:FkbM family methyltransferase
MRRSRFHYYRNAMLTPPYWLWVKGQLCRVVASSEAGAASCYAEVAVEDCYEMFSYARRATPQVIVDIGANFGMFSKLCSILFPEADIYAYEPHPEAVSWLQQNAAGTRIRVLPFAVGGTSGMVKLDTACDSTNASVKDDGDFPVECVAGSDLAAGHQIDFLKMDCEGHEWAILRDPSLLKRTKEFRLAYHLHGRSVEELKRLIEAAGHRVVECFDTKDGGKYGMIHSALDPESDERARQQKAGIG